METTDRAAAIPESRRLLRVVAPHFVAGAVWQRNESGWHCIGAAPILQWMLALSPQATLDVLRVRRYAWEWVRE
jgi:hypothetical protein